MDDDKLRFERNWWGAHPGGGLAGVDEAGRGCLAGPVVAGAVMMPPELAEELYRGPLAGLNDSKQLSAARREAFFEILTATPGVAAATGSCSPQEIDEMNILRASITAMHRAIDRLSVRPEALIIDGNRFYPYHDLPYTTIVKGDGKYLSIAAASILAKTYRDDYMRELHKEYPYYGWDHNAGYPTKEHRRGIAEHGLSPYHRLTFNQLGDGQLSLDF